MATIGSLSVKLGLVTVTWDQATEKAKKQAKDLQLAFNNLGKELSVVQRLFGSMAGGFNLATVGIAALAAKSITLSRDVKDMADSFGLSTSKILEYRLALEQSGVASANTAKVLSSAFQKIDEAQQGKNVDVVNKLNKMGISLSEIANMQPDKALERLAQGILTLDTAFERQNMQAFFFGKGGKTFGPESFLEKMKEIKGTMDQTGDSVNRLATLDDNLQKSLQNLELAFGDLLSKFVGNDGLNISINQFKVAIGLIASAYVIKNVYQLAMVFLEVYSALRKVLAMEIAIDLATPGLQKFAAAGLAALAGFTILEKTGVFDVAIDKLKKLAIGGDEAANGIGAVNDSLGGLNTPSLLTNSKGKASAKPDKKGSALYNELYGAQAAQVALEKQQIEFEKRSLDIKLQSYDVDKFVTKEKELQLKKDEQLAQLIADQKSATKGKAGEEKRLIEETYKYKKQLIEQSYQDEVAINEKEKQLAQDWLAGWKGAYKDYINESKNAGDRAAEAFRNLTQSLEDTLTTFFETGKLNFKSFAQSIIHEIARMQAQAAAKSIMGLFGGGGGGIGGIFSSLASSIFGGGSPAALLTGSTGESYGSILTGKATGGDVNAGTPYMVGENGPEMFIPSQAGSIAPRTTLGSMMGQNQPQVVYNGPYIANMSAIDTQSGLQFLAKNKQGVWAANQSAQRGLPQSR